MRAVVIKAFTDAENPSNVYMPNAEFEGRQERIKDLAAKGYVRAIEEENSEDNTQAKKRTVKRKATK